MTHDEIESLKVGNVILFGTRRTPRIVRCINKPPTRSWTKYDVYTVQVAIRHCSWTGGADTFIDRHALRTKCEKAGYRVKLDGADDFLFELELAQHKETGADWIMGCCLAKKLPA